MANEKEKKSDGDLIQKLDLPKTAHFYSNRNDNLLTKISFAHNLQLNQWANNGYVRFTKLFYKIHENALKESLN